MPHAGTGDGESVTNDAYLVRTEVGPMIDTPGVDDTRLRFTSDEAGRKVAIAMAASGATRVKFLIFESLANDSMQLRDTLEKLVLAFGEDALRAAVVLATKADRLQDPSVRERRLANINKVVREQRMQGVVVWQNQGIGDAGHAEQLASLRGALGKFGGTALADLEDLRQRQRARAQQKCDDQPTETRWEDVVVDEQYVVPREVEEPYEEAYSAREDYMEDYDTVEVYEETVTGPGADGMSFASGAGNGASIGALFGPLGALVGAAVGFAAGGTKELIKEDNRGTVTVQKMRTVTKQRPASRDVVKFRTAYRTVTHHDVETRKVTKRVEKPHRRPVEDFMEEALREIIGEVRRSLGEARSKL